jgi:hypothetical protein
MPQRMLKQTPEVNAFDLVSRYGANPCCMRATMQQKSEKDPESGDRMTCQECDSELVFEWHYWKIVRNNHAKTDS